jgi:hypothetical protein
MMVKRGQITLFIILALIAGSTIIIYSFSTINKNTSYNNEFLEGRGLSSDVQVIRSNIFDCIEETTKQSLITIGVQGGHYNTPEKYHKVGEGFFSYYYYEGNNIMPTKKEFENAISEYIEDNLEECITTKDYPIDTEYSRIIVKTAIKEETVSFTIDSQISFEEEGILRIIEIRDTQFEQKSYLKGMIEVAEYLTEYHNVDPTYVCFSCLSKIADERKVNAEIYNFPEEENTVHVIIYEEETNSPNLFMLSYLNKYTGNEKSPLFED